jgi:hypothetical protein
MLDMPHIERSLASYLSDAIKNDYLITAIITSYTQAKRKTQNLPFGLGKTTLACWLSHLINGKDWDTVFNQMVYNPYNLAKLLEPGSPRKLCVVWDDVQATAPAEVGVPKAIRKLANFISTERPEVACLIFTAPNINMISSPLRRLVNFEIIVSERGQYEVHKITYHKDFRRPLIDRATFDYMEELSETEPFQPLPNDVLQKYQQWRVEQKLLLYPNVLTELNMYVKLQQWNKEVHEEIPTITSKVIKAANGYAVMLPHAIGEKLHLKNVELAIAQTPS